jgi:hypothetical protein
MAFQGVIPIDAFELELLIFSTFASPSEKPQKRLKINENKKGKIP